MSDQDPFTEDTPKDVNPFADQLGNIKGEDGNPKYKSVEDALSALAHSQEHIKRLEAERAADEAEKARLSEELTKMGSVDDFVKRMTENKSTPETKTPDQPTTPDVSGLKEEDVVGLIKKALADNETQTAQQRNYEQVVSKIKETYKDKSSEVFNKKAQEMGTSPEKLLNLAKENPKLVLSLFNEVKTSSPTTSSVHIPPKQSNQEVVVEQPKKSMLVGASAREQAELWKQIRAKTYQDLGVEAS